jgi:hypothetical protein
MSIPIETNTRKILIRFGHCRRLWEIITLRNTCVTRYHGYVPFAVITIWYFSHSWFITRVTRGVPIVEQELVNPPDFTSILSGVRIGRSLVFCVVFCWSLFVLFLSVIVLSVLLRITALISPLSGYLQTFLMTSSICAVHYL